jgi:DNA-binding MarR family transcriptional regulator
MSTHERRVARRRNTAFSLAIASNLVGQLLEREHGRGDLNANDLALLSGIGIWGPVKPTELAAHLGMPATTLSTRAASLADRGYVVRVPNPADGRSHLLELSDKGRQAWAGWGEAIQAALGKIEANLERPIDDVEETLVELEAALRSALADTTS